MQCPVLPCYWRTKLFHLVKRTPCPFDTRQHGTPSTTTTICFPLVVTQPLQFATHSTPYVLF